MPRAPATRTWLNDYAPLIDHQAPMKRLGWFILAGCLLIAAAIARRSPPDVGPPAQRVVRTYDVSDLINIPPPDPADDANSAPPIVPANRLDARSFGGNVRSSGSGSGSGGPPDPPEKQRLDQLVELVRTGIEPASWIAGGGSITHFGRRLVIVQTRENHQLVQGLLSELRANPPRQVRLDIIWATLRPDDLARVLIAPTGDAASPATLIDLDALQRLHGAIAWRGHLTCASGQRGRLCCGRSHTVPTAIEPIISSDSGGFASKSQELLDGATIDVLPSLSPDGRGVIIDVNSEVTRWGPASQLSPFEIPVPATPGGTPAGGIVKIDRLNLGVQTLATSARGPADAAILMGGTTDPDATPGDPRQLYLIVRASESIKRNVRP
ncbi:MAG: hypothetical protein JWN40_4557 [Phycisphaerales bacterium]|nr:hypothetical protein [Phycisphaerales bacterium]